MYSALIIGCGNIGAHYDLNQPKLVWTHAKAFALNHDIEFSVTDKDRKIALKIGRKYRVKVQEIEEIRSYINYDVVSIATPTKSHFKYLSKSLRENVPLIICEKPIAANVKELDKLLKLYKQSESRVLVNFIRRFQPAYLELKQLTDISIRKNKFTAIIIKYQRGVLNNGSHAFDLLEFLFNEPFLFEDFKMQKVVFDAFSFDPTVSGSCSYLGCPVMLLGVEEAKYRVFEIELYHTSGKIVICHSGNEIRFYESGKAGDLLFENKHRRKSQLLEKYMTHVIKHAIGILEGRYSDNFLQSVDLNKRILKLISTIRN